MNMRSQDIAEKFPYDGNYRKVELQLWEPEAGEEKETHFVFRVCRGSVFDPKAQVFEVSLTVEEGMNLADILGQMLQELEVPEQEVA